MKKFIYVLVVGVVTAFLCMGCGSDKEGTAKAENTEQQTTEEATAIPEETLAPTPEATEEPREEVTIENEKTEATPEPTEEPTPEPTEEPVPQYTYTDMSATMYAQQTVNIRDLPDTDGNKLGSLSTNDEITITGQCNETSWYRFEYNGTETVEPEPTEEPTPEPEPQAIYTYTDMSATMYAQQTVNVRDLPDTNGNKIGSLSTNDEITISAKCNETGWYRFEYNGSVAYVSNKYVGENKFEIQQAPTDNGTEQMQATVNSGTPEWTSGVLRENYGQYEDGTYWTYTCGVGAPTSTYWTNVCNIIDYEYVGKYNVNVYHLFNGEYRYSYLTDREIYKVHCGNINCIYAMDN